MCVQNKDKTVLFVENEIRLDPRSGGKILFEVHYLHVTQGVGQSLECAGQERD